jgi:hypothetical protein
MTLFDHAMVRFAVSGTLILLYGIADHRARRRAPATPAPRGMRVVIFLSITAYYLLIGPYGGSLLGGAGNLAGIALVGAAALYRHRAPVRYPEIAGRCLFYVALPLAVGVPWGWVALSLPACAASLWWCLRAERRAAAAPPVDGFAAPRFRLVPGLW